MGTTPTVLSNAVDTTVYSKFPDRNANWATVNRLGISGSIGGFVAENYFFFALPFPRGVTVLSAVFSFSSQLAYPASTTMTVQRIAAAWNVNTLTWNTKPAVEGATATQTKASTVANQRWSVDVTALMQTVSNGANWFGFRLNSSSTTLYNYIWSAQAEDPTLRPTLTITWADNPLTPSQLFPSGGRAVGVTKPILQCNFIDLSGDTSMQAIQVQLDNAADFATPTFDSGAVTSAVPELNLAATAFTGLVANTLTYWRVRVQDGAGLWSNWSAPASMIYQTRGTLTMTSPAAPPNNSVAEATPPISWTFTGRTQTAFEIIITLYTSTSPYIRRQWSTGKITSAANTYTIPDDILRQNNWTYTVELRVWDNIDREATPGDPIWYSVVRDFTYVYDATVNPVTGLTSTLHTAYPWVKLSWSRSAQPDRWNIYRNGKLIKTTTTGNELFVSGTSYEYWDRTPQPRTNNVYTVIPVVNNKGSSGNPTTTIAPRAFTVTLASLDGTTVVMIMNAGSSDMNLNEISSVYTPAGGGAPVLIAQANTGFQGKVQGRLATAKGISVDTAKAAFKQLASNPGQPLNLTLVTEAFECFIANATYKPVPRTEEVVYDVSFDFYQTDFLP